MQSQIVAGESFSATVLGDTYPASSGWVVTLYLNPRAGGTASSVVATASGDDHLLQVAAAVTQTWATGWYAWETYAAKDPERYRLEAGQLQVVAGLIGVAAGADTRSAAQIALDDATAALAAWNPSKKRYRINGREMEFNSPADIIAVITYWTSAVKREQAAQDMAAGRPNPRKLHVRLGRA